MKLKGRVQVEQLDDERLTNIERKLVVAVSDMAPQPDRAWFSRRAVAFAGVAMAVALAGIVGWKLHAPPPTTVPIASGESHEFDLRSDGNVKVTHAPGRVDLAMTKGRLELSVPHVVGRLLVVHAGDTDIEDVGTKFSVDYDGAGHVEVRVTEGEVKVKRAGKDFEVTASNAWSTETGTTTIAQLDSAVTNVVAQNDIVIDTPAQQAVTPKTGSAANNAGGSNAGSGTGSAGKRKFGVTNVKDAIEKFALDPLPGTIVDYREQLKTATEREKSRILYSIAVKQHEAKQDADALHTLEAFDGRTKDAGYADAMWLRIRITCMHALDDRCRSAAQGYINNIPSGAGAGIADQILRAITLGE